MNHEDVRAKENKNDTSWAPVTHGGAMPSFARALAANYAPGKNLIMSAIARNLEKIFLHGVVE